MRQITTRYSNACRACGDQIDVGQPAIYEKRVGIFHLACAPNETEEIRTYRQEAAERKADKYDEWAQKRREKAAALDKLNAPFRGDIAFNTQPGHIPERARVIKRTEKIWEHTSTANRMSARADALRSGVRVAGDAERKRQAQRDKIRSLLQVGMQVDTVIFGIGTVKKINKKTATIESCGTSKDYTTTVDLSFLRLLSPTEEPRQ